MGHAVVQERVEGRAHVRRSAVELPWLSTARFRPGERIRLIDLSSGGALVETRARPIPGAQVTLAFGGAGPIFIIRGRIVRADVSSLDRVEGIRYRSAIRFDDPVSLPAPAAAQ